LVAYKRLSLAAAVRARRRIRESRTAWRKGKEGEQKKDCFLDTSEATILLKIKAEYFENA